MTLIPLALAALTVLPSDRMAMADRLFDRGSWREARAEYVALKGADGIASDELLYRFAECDRALGDLAAARREYGEIIEKHPLSRHAARARLMRALSGTDAEKRSELKMLDSDGVEPSIRAVALYHLGTLTDDADLFRRSCQLDPKGPYAIYAKFRHAALTAESADAAQRRAAITELLEIHYGADKALAREALYLAASRSYAEKRYSEAAALFRRFLKVYPDDAKTDAVINFTAWCDYLSGRYADAARLCGEGKTDDTAYLIAACAYASGELSRARDLMKKYLADWPQGRYRAAVELPLARMEFDEADQSGDATKTIEAARRGVNLSKSSPDRLRLAWAYEKGAREAEALAEYAAIARDFPDTDDAAEALFRKAMVDLRAQRWSAGEMALAEALASGKNAKRRAESLYWRGIAANQLGHAAEARGFLQDALAAGVSLDESREARLVIADIDFKAGRVKDAREAYAQLVREGAAERMSAARLQAVGRFLLSDRAGERSLDEAKLCGRTLVANGATPEWRQIGYAIQGEAEEAGAEFTAALESYRKSLAENVRTEAAASVALALGVLESKAGNHAAADTALREAVRLNASDVNRRATAYLWLAKNCEASTDYRGAFKYATVVETLFDDPALLAEAKRIIDANREAAE